MTGGQAKEQSWVSEHFRELMAAGVIVGGLIAGFIGWMWNIAYGQGVLDNKVDNLTTTVGEVRADVKALTSRPVQQQQQAVTIAQPNEERLRLDAQDKIIQEMARGNVFRTIHAKVGEAGGEGDEVGGQDDSAGAGRVAPSSDQRVADGDDPGA